MGKYEYIFFDLDGTVFDSGIGIKKSACYALNKFNISVKNINNLNRFIGPPLKNSFMDFYGMSSEQAKLAISYYREYYSDKGIYEGNIYDGIHDLLKYICSNGMKAVLSTSKPELFAEKILKHFDLYQYFTLVSGASLDESLVEKYDIIMNAFFRLDITDLSKILMVGDRKYDIEGARCAGISSAGVLYGYGSYKELYSAGADYIVSNTEELVKILL